MKIVLLLGAAASALIAAPAIAQPQPPAPSQTRNFVQAASASDTYEILAAQTALAESRNPRVRAFAGEMVQAHARTSADLQQATARSALPPPPMSMSTEQSQMLNALQSLKPPEFDKTYMQQQVMAHRSALVTEQDYAGRGADPNVRRVAAAGVPVIQHHLDMAEALNSALPDPT